MFLPLVEAISKFWLLWYYISKILSLKGEGIIMERGFKYLIDIHGQEGARNVFEEICIQIFQHKYGPEAKAVRLSQGDGGIDVLVGDLPAPRIIYQCKFFPDEIGSSQKKQITDSFETATRNYTPRNWYLCLPLTLDKEELLWWSKWKAERETTNLKIELCDGSYLIRKLKDYKMYSQIFDDDIRNALQKILEEMTAFKEDVANEIIYGYDYAENIVVVYQDYIFVKMLESANIKDTDACIIDFYNAEIAMYTELSKDAVEGLRIYNNLKNKIHSLWRTQYRIINNSNDGNNLLGNVCQRIEDLDSTMLKTSGYSLLAKNGILHQLADEKKLGWIENYLIKLSEYMEQNL